MLFSVAPLEVYVLWVDSGFGDGSPKVYILSGSAFYDRFERVLQQRNEDMDFGARGVCTLVEICLLLLDGGRPYNSIGAHMPRCRPVGMLIGRIG